VVGTAVVDAVGVMDVGAGEDDVDAVATAGTAETEVARTLTVESSRSAVVRGDGSVPCQPG
jgi:hypothetical protein